MLKTVRLRAKLNVIVLVFPSEFYSYLILVVYFFLTSQLPFNHNNNIVTLL